VADYDPGSRTLSNITNLTQTGWEGNVRSWSPDGATIYVSSGRRGSASQGGFEIFSMNRDGSNVQRLTTNSVNDGDPRVSPNGMKMVFVREEEGPNTQTWRLHVGDIAPTGLSNVVKIAEILGNEPVWRR
jgi:Tol biopolymer transport system component